MSGPSSEPTVAELLGVVRSLSERVEQLEALINPGLEIKIQKLGIAVPLLFFLGELFRFIQHS